MPDIEADLQHIEEDARLCQKITDILIVLSRAEKQGRDLYEPLRQIEDDLNDLHNEHILDLYRQLMDDLQNGIKDKQNLADDQFSFILLLCYLLNDIKTTTSAINLDEKALDLLVPA